MDNEFLPRLLTASEVSKQTGIPLWRLYERTRAGDLPCVRIGRSIRYLASEVRAWILNGGSQRKERER